MSRFSSFKVRVRTDAWDLQLISCFDRHRCPNFGDHQPRLDSRLQHLGLPLSQQPLALSISATPAPTSPHPHLHLLTTSLRSAFVAASPSDVESHRPPCHPLSPLARPPGLERLPHLPRPYRALPRLRRPRQLVLLLLGYPGCRPWRRHQSVPAAGGLQGHDARGCQGVRRGQGRAARVRRVP